MMCRYFNEDCAGFCTAAEFSHIPSIDEMEQFCFKNFRSCPILDLFKENQKGKIYWAMPPRKISKISSAGAR